MQRSIVRKNRSRRLMLESLEGRQLLSTFTVNSMSDDINGPIGDQMTLRDAINSANSTPGHSDIQISFPMIALDAALPTITGDLSIQTPTSSNLTVWYGGSTEPILTVASSATVEIDNLTITGNHSQGIQNAGNLTLKNDVFSDCVTTGNGGAIYNSGILSVTASEFRYNSANLGGAIYDAGTLTQTENVFISNVGGDIYQQPISVLIITVNSLADDVNGPVDGQTTLRDAINQADANPSTPSTINFSIQGTIKVGGLLPTIVGNLTINGNGSTVSPYMTIFGNRDGNPVLVSGIGNSGSIFTIAPNASVAISDMTITGCNGIISAYQSNDLIVSVNQINNHGSLTLNNDVLTGGLGNGTSFGGAVYNDGTLVISNSVFSANSIPVVVGLPSYPMPGGQWSAPGLFWNNQTSHGGAIYNTGAMTLTNSTFSDNNASIGKAIYNNGSVFSQNCKFTDGGVNTGVVDVFNSSNGTFMM